MTANCVQRTEWLRPTHRVKQDDNSKTYDYMECLSTYTVYVISKPCCPQQPFESFIQLGWIKELEQ